VARAAERRLDLHRSLLQPAPAVLAELDRLRAEGYRIGLISDCSAETPVLWPDTPLAQRVDAAVFSCTMRTRKPDPALYRAVAAELGVEPERCAYVGDGASDELNGAAALGMTAIQLRPPVVDERERAERASIYGAKPWIGPVIEELGQVRRIVALNNQVAYWDEAAGSKTFTHPLHAPWLDGVDRRAAVLDYGCGYGRSIGELARQGFENLVGADISAGMISRARQAHPASRFSVIGSPPALAEPDASVDVVLLFAVLTCVPGDHAQRALIAELMRVLKPSGLLYISDLLSQDDERNRDRYARNIGRYGTYGVFETGDGAVCRHHSREHLAALVSGFQVVEEREIEVGTMNGHRSTGIQILARKPGPTPAPTPGAETPCHEMRT
jgi:HAD superfamily hydrolase (TIGR01509 family)